MVIAEMDEGLRCHVMYRFNHATRKWLLRSSLAYCLGPEHCCCNSWSISWCIIGKIIGDKTSLGKCFSQYHLHYSYVLKGKKLTGRVLVVCPLSVMNNWQEELLRWWGLGDSDGHNIQVHLFIKWWIDYNFLLSWSSCVDVSESVMWLVSRSYFLWPVMRGAWLVCKQLLTI